MWQWRLWRPEQVIYKMLNSFSLLIYVVGMVTMASVVAPLVAVPSPVEVVIIMEEAILEDMPRLEEGDVEEDAGRKREKRQRK